MVTFTDMGTASGSFPTRAAMASIAAPTTNVAPESNENTDPPTSMNSARSLPQKTTRPAALNLKASPVRQRLLRDTKMSSAIPSPRTPTGGQKTTSRAQGTPSSAKLEVGRDSFRFSMDLPPSKITPKKGTTPKQQSPARAGRSTPTKAATAKPDLKTRTPTKKTPSPHKNRNSVQQSPNKKLFQTPTKKGALDRPNNGRPCSPVKRAIELGLPSKPVNLNMELARNLAPHPDHVFEPSLGFVAHAAKEDDYDTIPTTCPLPNPREFLPPVRKRRPEPKPQPQNTGQLMAKPGSDNTTIVTATAAMSTTHEWASSCIDEVFTSPALAPLHTASEKLHLADSLSYTRRSNNSATSVSNTAAGIEFEEGSTTIISESSVIQRGESEDDDTAFKKNSGSFIDVYMVHNVQLPQYPPYYPEPASKRRQGETRVDSGKQVDCQDTNDSTVEAIKPQPLDISKRIPTDPNSISNLQGDTQTVQKTKRWSLRAVSPEFCGPVNLSGLPSIPDSHSTVQQGVRSPGEIGTPTKPKSLHHNSSSLPRATTGSPGRAALSKMPRTPTMSRRPVGSTSALMQEKTRITAERSGVGAAVSNNIKGPGTRHPASTTPTKFTKPAAATSSIPNKTFSTPNKQGSSSTKRTSARPISQILSANPTGMKAPAVTTPKQPPSKPASKPIAPNPKPESSDLKSTRPVSKLPATSHKLPLQPTRSETCDASAGPRQPLLPRITSATDIAERLARWQVEARRKSNALSKRTSLALPTRWSKTPAKPEVIESTTPQGSPPTLDTPPPTSTTPMTFAPPPRSSSPLNIDPILARHLPPPPPPPRQRPHHAAQSANTTTTTNTTRYLSPKPALPMTRGASRYRTRASPSVASPSAAAAPAIQIPSDNYKHNENDNDDDDVDHNARHTPSKTIIHSLDRAIDAKITEDARRGVKVTPGGNRVSLLLKARGRGV